MSQTSVLLENLTVGYDRRPVLHHLFAQIPQGVLVAVIGANGCGKSTLLKTIAREIKPMSGRLQIPPAKRIAYLAQTSQAERDFPISVVDFVSFGLWHQTGAFAPMKKAHGNKVSQILEEVGLEHGHHWPIQSLSGGEYQRMLFARLWLQDAALILLDEPLLGLDMHTATTLMKKLVAATQQGKTVLVVMHHLDLVAEYCPLCMLLSQHSCELGATRSLLPRFQTDFDHHLPEREMGALCAYN